MATYTENYNLIKPEEEDYYTVNDFNENMDCIDGVMAATERAMEEVESKADKISEDVSVINQKIGTSSTNKTLFSLLETGTKNGFTAIKSLQYVTTTLASDSTSSTVSLQKTVIPANCFVLLERLSGNPSNKLTYTLNTSNLRLSYTDPGPYTFIYGFWIIELT